MNIIKNTFLLIAILLNVKLQAMNTIKSRITPAGFKELATYTQSFLQEHMDKLACQKNESGFVRINVPVSKTIKSNFDGIEKVRLNYWSPVAGVTIRPESIHTHPNYFESFIINGGYSHAVYQPGDKKNKMFDLYRILKNNDEKSFAFIGRTKLKHVKDESVEKGSIVIFNKDLIHKVLATQPETLTLNATFNAPKDEDQSSYNVYLSKKGTLDDIRTTRDIIVNNKSKPLIQEIVTYLSQLTKTT